MRKKRMHWFWMIALLTLTVLAQVNAFAEVEGIVRHGVTPTELQTQFIEGYGENGYRAVRLSGYRSGNATRFITRWLPDNPAIDSKVHFDRTLAQFDALNLNYRNQNFYLVDASAYNTAVGVRYAGIWYKNTGGVTWTTYRDVSLDVMQLLHDTIGQNGWRPQRIEGYVIGGQSRFISIWYHKPNTGSIWHSKMTRAQYDTRLADYKDQGYALVHIDAHTVNDDVFYSGIWRQPANGFPRVRTNRDGREYQRYYNNYWADGYNIDNFYVAETPGGLRYGGIWYFDGAPNINENSSLHLRVRKEISEAPALGGAAILNLTTGQETSVFGDQTFAIASTSKIGILYALLREIDQGDISWFELVNSDTSSGGNQCDYLQADTNYTVNQLARFMIRCSNNWATNILIERIGRATINQHLDTLGLDVTRIHRFMTGGPSAHGNASANADRAEGWENVSTPREMVKLLRRVLQDNVLSNLSETRFWDVLGDDNDGVGANNRGYIGGQVAGMFNPAITVFNKAGSLSGPEPSRHVRADAGRLRMPDGTEVLIAVFMDFIADSPDALYEATDDAMNQAEQRIKNIAKEAANQYYP